MDAPSGDRLGPAAKTMTPPVAEARSCATCFVPCVRGLCVICVPMRRDPRLIPYPVVSRALHKSLNLVFMRQLTCGMFSFLLALL
ncbi:hypothetical protein L596_014440 [Steinernema carpocapsae]|uniref:RecR protein domain-containing protein n=1 Tax=Steinernema carpocapsae TaxID=34508 RepID=A0A4V6A2S8_STECR|nr:hypothetical protein L596_014440 [Steinernema carpocapsae]